MACVCCVLKYVHRNPLLLRRQIHTPTSYGCTWHGVAAAFEANNVCHNFGANIGHLRSFVCLFHFHFTLCSVSIPSRSVSGGTFHVRVRVRVRFFDTDSFADDADSFRSPRMAGWSAHVLHCFSREHTQHIDASNEINFFSSLIA